jgi:hypothetical protein
MTNPDPEEIYSDAETEARAAAALKRMLNTPHKPHNKLGRDKPAHSRSRKKPD